MADFKRQLDLLGLLKEKSYFLFGPRAVGKTTLIDSQLKNFQKFDLLDGELRLKLLSNPHELSQMLDRNNAQGYVIDEIQKVPELLDEVHRIIQKEKRTFLLTGSSARKLKRGGANLLAGRARTASLFPLIYNEIPDFDLDKRVLIGGLPDVYLSDKPFLDLKAYVDTYIKEEIQAEGVTRSLPQFARFLSIAAQTSGQLINYRSVGSDAQVKELTVKNYYQILVDTLLGFIVEPFTGTKTRKAIQTEKFYFFDSGVVHQILGIKTLSRNQPNWGMAFESWIAQELLAYLSYNQIDEPLRFWRSVNHHEVDFCLGDKLAIEVKAKTIIKSRDLSGLRALGEEKIFKKRVIICMEPVLRQTEDGILIIPWEVFFKKLWVGEFL